MRGKFELLTVCNISALFSLLTQEKGAACAQTWDVSYPKPGTAIGFGMDYTGREGCSTGMNDLISWVRMQMVFDNNPALTFARNGFLIPIECLPDLCGSLAGNGTRFCDARRDAFQQHIGPTNQKTHVAMYTQGVRFGTLARLSLISR